MDLCHGRVGPSQAGLLYCCQQRKGLHCCSKWSLPQPPHCPRVVPPGQWRSPPAPTLGSTPLVKAVEPSLQLPAPPLVKWDGVCSPCPLCLWQAAWAVVLVLFSQLQALSSLLEPKVADLGGFFIFTKSSSCCHLHSPSHIIAAVNDNFPVFLQVSRQRKIAHFPSP